MELRQAEDEFRQKRAQVRVQNQNFEEEELNRVTASIS
jgi:hypothetical protein